MSHIFRVRSALPEATHWFSGWNATEVTTLENQERQRRTRVMMIAGTSWNGAVWDLLGVVVERVQRLMGGDIPQLHQLIVAAGRH